MYKYKIGYGTCEEFACVELEHKDKFSKADITRMVAEAIEAIFPDKMKHAKNEKGYYYEFAFKFEQFWTNGLNETNIISWLIENKGFKQSEYELTWSVFGWASVLDKKDWNGDRGKNDELAKITTYLNKKGIKKENFPFENWKSKK